MPKDNVELSEVVKAVDEIKTAFEELQKTADERDAEILKKGDFDGLLKDKLQRISDDMDKHQKSIDEFYLAQKKKSIYIDGKEVSQEELDRKAYLWAEVASQGRKGKTMPDTFGQKEADEYKDAYGLFLREGKDALSEDEKKALSVGSDPDGGYTVDPDTSGRIIQRIYETSPMRSYASVQMISTESLEGMYDNEEADMGWVGESASRPETGTPQLGTWSIPVHEMYAMPKATQKLLDDSNIDVEGWLAGKVSAKFSRVENTSFVSGTGINQPRGFLDYDAAADVDVFELDALGEVNSGAAGDFVADPNGGDVLITVLYKLKAEYRRNTSWFMNRSTMAAIRLLKDSNGHMLWQPALTAGQPSTLLGHGVAEFDDMPDLAANSLSIAVGDMGSAYQIVDRLGIRTLRDPFTAKPHVLFYATKRVGGDVVDFDALKRIKFAA